MVAYLGTNDMRVVEQRIKKGDKKAAIVYEAMAYQLAKEIGAMATVLGGEIDAIVLTGGMANSTKFTEILSQRIKFIAPIHIIPGEQEMNALALGALRVLNNEEQAKTYHFD